MVVLRIAIKSLWVRNYLIFFNHLKSNEVALILVLLIVKLWLCGTILLWIEESTLYVSGWCCFIECTILTRSCCVSWRIYFVFFNVSHFVKYFAHLLLPFFLFIEWITDVKDSLLIHKVRGSRSTWNLAVDAIPCFLERTLNAFKSIKCWHLRRLLLRRS